MLSDDEIRTMLRHGEADHVERTQSRIDRRKFGEAICAFANDLPDRRQAGVLFVGVKDNGDCAHIPIDDQLLQTLMGLQDRWNDPTASGDACASPYPRWLRVGDS